MHGVWKGDGMDRILVSLSTNWQGREMVVSSIMNAAALSRVDMYGV